MRLAISKGIIIVACILVLGGLVYVDSIEEASGTEQKIELAFMLGNEIINAWESEDVYYLFLPSYAETDKIKLLSYSTEFEIADRETLVMRGGNLSNIPLNEKLSCKTTATKETFTFCVMKSESLPTVFMETDSGTTENITTDKAVEENGKIQVLSETGELLYQGGLKSIKGRGNYSFTYFDKKSISITVKEAVSLLGLGMGTKYSLVANASDSTLIRNELARRIEETLETEYTNVGRFVDLYVNGEYQGNYYLCENIEIGTERINITNLETQMNRIYQKANYDSFTTYETENKKAKRLEYNPADITGGYLVERDFEDRYKLEYADNPSSFITEGEEHFIVKSPVYCSDEQIDYLADYFNQAEAALLSEDGIHPETGRSYEEYIDVDSFVKKYLVEEVTKNYDGGVSGSYFYKDSDTIDGRIKAAPIWDCDMSLGSYLEWMSGVGADPTGVSKLSLHWHASPWYEALYEKENVYEMICTNYKERIVPYLEELLTDGLDEYESKLSASAAMNDIRWRVDLQRNSSYVNRDTSFSELNQFIKERKDFLDKVWMN